MKKLKGLILVFLAIVLVSTFTYTIADVGNFESYGSDWGSSSSWGSDWSSSSNSSLDYDWGSSSSSNRNHEEYSSEDYAKLFLYIAKCICFWVASYFMARLFLTILPIINEKKNRLKSFLNYEKKSGKKEITKMIMKIVKMIAKLMIIFFVVISYSHGRIEGKSITGVLVAMNAIWLIAIGMSWLGILNCRIVFMIACMTGILCEFRKFWRSCNIFYSCDNNISYL